MNGPLRRLALVSFVLFALLLASSTWTQALDADDLRKDPRNRRTQLALLSRERGPIIVAGEAIARSEPVDDEYKFQRTYPQGELYAHVTGYFSLSTSSGVEQAMNPLLAGTDEQQFVDQLTNLLTGEQTPGATVTTTIDPKVQQAATDALAGRRGAVAALDPKTGAVKAMVSTPSYDPNQLATHDRKAANEASQRLQTQDDRPLINRAIGGDLYPPGSTFKVITAAAGLESGSVTANSTLPGPAVLDLPGTTAGLPNYSPNPCGPNDEVSLHDALVMSCNTAFGALGMRLGGDAIREQADKFGFGEELRIPVRVTPSRIAEQMNEPQEAQSAIGQYEDRVTPMQMAMVAAGIANDGIVMTPYLVDKVQAPDLKDLQSAKPQRLRRAVSQSTADDLT
ncbi:MAG: cell division protein FtsI, partial [Micrococcales bacterium]